MLVGSLLAAATSGYAGDALPSALFYNDGSDAKTLGIQIRKRSGTCEEQRRQDHTPICLQIAMKGPREYRREDLGYCFRFIGESESERCSSALLRIDQVVSPTRMRGTYDITFTSGLRRKGAFDAIYCEPSAERPVAPPNNAIKLSVRPVTPLACASVAPARPAAYRVRWTDD